MSHWVTLISHSTKKLKKKVLLWSNVSLIFLFPPSIYFIMLEGAVKNPFQMRDPFDALKAVDTCHHWQPFERNLDTAEWLCSSLLFNSCLLSRRTDKTDKNIISQPEWFLRLWVCCLWVCSQSQPNKWHPTVNYLPSSENVTTYWNRNVLFNMSCIQCYTFSSSCILLAIWALRNKSICIERTGGCATSVRIWIVALRAGRKKNIKHKNHEMAGGAGIWADIKRWLCVGFSTVLQRKNVNPVSVRLSIINSRNIRSTAQQTQTKRWKGGKV